LKADKCSGTILCVRRAHESPFLADWWSCRACALAEDVSARRLCTKTAPLAKCVRAKLVMSEGILGASCLPTLSAVLKDGAKSNFDEIAFGDFKVL
jgi:hypothetical protein